VPERNERRVVTGIKKAESLWDRYVRERLAAEHDTVALTKQLEETARQLEAANRAKEQAARG
jgi:hypothetical protein